MRIAGRQLLHRPPIVGDRGAKAGHVVRKQIRMEVGRTVPLAPIGSRLRFERAETETFHQIGRRGFSHREAEALAREAVVAAADPRARPFDAHFSSVGRAKNARPFLKMASMTVSETP